MPTYEYQCEKCGTVTDVFQGIKEKPLRKLRKTDNPNCACDAPVTRLLGRGAGIIFRGSGFYETDYRSDNYKKAAKAEKEGAAGTTKADGNGSATTDGKTKTPKGDAKKSSASDATPSKDTAAKAGD